MKIAYITDTHWRYMRPKCRADKDYLQTILGEFEYVLANCKSLGIKYLLHAGDVFDKPYISKDSTQALTVATAITSLLKEYNITMIVSPGQHDEFGQNSDSVDRSFLHMMVLTGLVKVSHATPIEIKDGTEKITVVGYPFEHPEQEEALNGAKKTTGFEIGMFHATLGYASQGYSKSIEACDPGCDVAVFGDVHDFVCEGYEHKSGCVSFCTGAFSQLTTKDVTRVLQFGVIEIEKGALLSYTTYELPISYDDSRFDIRGIDAKESGKLKALGAAVKRATSLQGENHSDMVKRIGKGLFGDRVINLVLDNMVE